MNENLQSLALTLKQKRLEHGYSSGDAAGKLGVSAAYYSRLENGKERPSKQILEGIATLYNLPPEDQRLLENLAGYATDVPSRFQNTVVEQNVSPQVSVKLDPEKTPVLYSDAMYVTISANGVTLDFGQKMGPTNEQHIVARIGVSLSHAKRIYKVLGDQLAKARKMGIEN